MLVYENKNLRWDARVRSSFDGIFGDPPIRTIEQLTSYTAQGLLSRVEFGRKCLNDVRMNLVLIGKHLSGDETWYSKLSQVSVVCSKPNQPSKRYEKEAWMERRKGIILRRSKWADKSISIKAAGSNIKWR